MQRFLEGSGPTNNFRGVTGDFRMIIGVILKGFRDAKANFEVILGVCWGNI